MNSEVCYLPLSGTDIHGSASILSPCYPNPEEELVIMTLGTIETGVRAISSVVRTEKSYNI
jgi:hypothetical protein